MRQIGGAGQIPPNFWERRGIDIRSTADDMMDNARGDSNLPLEQVRLACERIGPFNEAEPMRFNRFVDTIGTSLLKEFERAKVDPTDQSLLLTGDPAIHALPMMQIMRALLDPNVSGDAVTAPVERLMAEKAVEEAKHHVDDIHIDIMRRIFMNGHPLHFKACPRLTIKVMTIFARHASAVAELQRMVQIMSPRSISVFHSLLATQYNNSERYSDTLTAWEGYAYIPNPKMIDKQALGVYFQEIAVARILSDVGLERPFILAARTLLPTSDSNHLLAVSMLADECSFDSLPDLLSRLSTVKRDHTSAGRAATRLAEITVALIVRDVKARYDDITDRQLSEIVSPAAFKCYTAQAYWQPKDAREVQEEQARLVARLTTDLGHFTQRTRAEPRRAGEVE
ncbi:hypothetical protein J8273_2614 [Carpediemonas membranifera]|uniref:Uncharacterized protein n=1 Tax=Carpediemonas membranifera TaxID=201153 RepID=A0A8J6E3B1_9EUKA|nr:hypothetical protein J8273_2614 [Carpediemonas membranifera]|eukprot:KAG9395708.1 hypothetical protein J8273_2614 [Carpediemonas membranifera]